MTEKLKAWVGAARGLAKWAYAAALAVVWFLFQRQRAKTKVAELQRENEKDRLETMAARHEIEELEREGNNAEKERIEKGRALDDALSRRAKPPG